jgi:hypothetical protein
MNKKYVVRLSEPERSELERLVRTGKAARWKIHRARVLLVADQGPGGPAWPDERIAEGLQVSVRAIGNLRRRLVEGGLEAVFNRKQREHPPVLPKLDGAAEARLIALRCGQPPAGRMRWTLQLLADKLVELEVVESVSYETVRRALKKTS